MSSRTMRLWAPVLVSTCLAGPAIAAKPNVATKSVSPPALVGDPGKAAPIAKSLPDSAALATFIDKLFPPQPAPDPARLALAQESVRAMWPDGAYGKMMTSFIGGVFDRMMQLKSSDVEAITNRSAKPAANSKADLSLHDKVAGKDPYFDKRMAAMRDVVTEEMGRISAVVDPPMRNGLARAMARRFDARQLVDINRFFGTPTGQLFAAQYMQLWVDPETMRSLFGSVPQMMKLMPEIAQKLKAANDKFPKPPAPRSVSGKP